jgi:hypothetical protein
MMGQLVLIVPLVPSCLKFRRVEMMMCVDELVGHFYSFSAMVRGSPFPSKQTVPRREFVHEAIEQPRSVHLTDIAGARQDLKFAIR